jgi:hypothetical protein
MRAENQELQSDIEDTCDDLRALCCEEDND